MRHLMRNHAWLVVAAAVIISGAARPSMAAAVATDYNVVWTTPSTNSQGSMPLGNGDLGVNVWIENNKDLVFYLSKTDAWDENGSLLKLGKVRVSLPANTFVASGGFQQQFRFQDGTIQIDAGQGSAATTVKLWIDPSNPVVQVDVQRASAFTPTVTYEPWRTARRQLSGQEMDMAYGEYGSPTPTYVEADTTVGGQTNDILWYHRNERSVWTKNLQVQGLDPATTVGADVLMHNTFGAKITGANLVNVNSTQLTTSQATTHQVISVSALTAQTDTAQQWIDQLNQRIAQTESTPYDQRKAANDQRWSEFANQSYIRVTAGPNAAAVSQGYALQRQLNAFAGQGASPIKFNGSIFTVDTNGRTDLGAEDNLGPDYRRWGGAYWEQNTRFPYWSMLQNGQFQQMQPLFDMYLNNLNLAKERVKTYYGPQAQGAYFPEVMTHWGTWTSTNYGWSKSNPKDGVSDNQYIRYEWQGGIEVTAMMLQYYDYTGDHQFVQNKLLPLATEIVNFYDTHYGRLNGKLNITPAQALETWWSVVNPQPEVAGLHYVLDKLLALPDSDTTAAQRAQWTRLRGELPDLPTRVVSGKTIYSPGQTYSSNHNTENPELYGVFPYLMSGVGKSTLQMGIDTFNNRSFSGNSGWRQDSIDAALLGLSSTAQSLVAASFLAKDAGSRFPGFYGPNYDWIPDQDHPDVASIALQRMLIQVDGDQVLFFPAWPTNWDVEFRQFGPKGKIFMGDYESGAVKWMDPGADGLLSRMDYQRIMTNIGYNNQLNVGNLASLLKGDVNFDGRVTDADRAALFAAAAELGIDTSAWVLLQPGDANGDGTVNGADLNTVLSNYNQTDMDWSHGDFNFDGTVNGTDINTVLSYYNRTSGVGAAVPEPSALLLAIAGLAGLLADAWRKGK
jgi:alpha-L-fucosidase 2